MNKTLMAVIAGCGVLVGGNAVAAGEPKGMRISLVWTAKAADLDLGNLVISDTRGVTLRVESFKDTRQNPNRIGENREEDNEVLPVFTSDDVGAFCAKHLAETLRVIGLNVVDEGDAVLTAEVLEFFVTETSIYDGNVRLKVSVVDKAGPVWDGLVSGRGRRFGRSYNAENYQEALSEALQTAALNLIKNAGFQQALARVGRQPPVQ